MDVEQLNMAVDTATRLLATTSEGDSEHSTNLSLLAYCLRSRFERTGSILDLNNAVDAATRALQAASEGHPHRAEYLHRLGKLLASRFEVTGSMEDVNKAVDCAAAAVDATPDNDTKRLASRLHGYGQSLWLRFHRTSSMDDLNQAVGYVDSAAEKTTQDDPELAMYLNSLGMLLATRFQRTGSMEDINKAVDSAARSVEAVAHEHKNPDLAIHLSNLGNWLGARFVRTGSLDDLNRAIEAIKRTLDSTPQDHSDLPIYLNNLGLWLGRLFDRTKSRKHIDEAVEYATRAVAATPVGHADFPAYSDSLANILWRRFQATNATNGFDEDTADDSMEEGPTEESMKDLDAALYAATRAVEMTADGHIDLATHCHSLAIMLAGRWEVKGTIADLDKAIATSRRAVDVTPEDDPNRATHLNSLGDWLGSRYELTWSEDDLVDQFTAYLRAWSCETAPPIARIEAAQAAADHYAEGGSWRAASSLLRDAILLLPKISPRSSKHSDIQDSLVPLSGLASFAAAAALGADCKPEEAIGILELGRGIISGLVMDLRTDISSLKLTHPDLASKFSSLQDELDSSPDKNPSLSLENSFLWEARSRRLREADQELDRLLPTIRAKPGFGGFLQPPTAEEMMAAAAFGPIIVINTSIYRCDAFLIEENNIRAIELPDLTYPDIEDRAEGLQDSPDLKPVQEWLWVTICRPCLDALGFTGPVRDDEWPHVWWIATGLLSRFPMHSAGLYTSDFKETVMDRVVSSYASSIKALRHGRRQNARVPHRESPGEPALLVAMPKTPGFPAFKDLPVAEEEAQALRDICPSLQLVPVTPPKRREEILKGLQGCSVFHFAGHGESDLADPSQSYLMLDDWQSNKLTVGDVRASRLQDHPPFLAYLSACSTGANWVGDLADEGIHLVSAFQLAGFRHVIGTLWKVSDKACLTVARIFYETLRDEGMTDVAVSRGLHRALMALRDEGRGNEAEGRDATLVSSKTQPRETVPRNWIPYVHFGV